MALFRGRALRQAEKLASRGKFEEAVVEYHKVLAREPDDTSTLNRVGDLYIRLGRVDEAVKLFRRTAEHYADDGFLVKAIAIYKKILRIAPDELGAHEDLAGLYQRQGLRMDARAHYEILVDRLRKRDDPGWATDVFRRMIELEPDRTSNRAKLIGLLRQQDRTEEALEETRELAAQLIERDRIEEAGEVYIRALDFGAQESEFVRAARHHLQTVGDADLVARFEEAAGSLGVEVAVPESEPSEPLPAETTDGAPAEAPEEALEEVPEEVPEETAEVAEEPAAAVSPQGDLDREIHEFLADLSGPSVAEEAEKADAEVEIIEVEGVEEPEAAVEEPKAAAAEIEAPERQDTAEAKAEAAAELEVEEPGGEVTLDLPADGTGDSGFFDLAAELEAELDDELPAEDAELLKRGDEQSMEAVIAGLKKGVSGKFKPEDYDTRYSLGIAYREMGLVDEAIGEFQLAAKDPRYLVECCGLLGACFQEKGLPELAVRWYKEALSAPDVARDAELGLRYELGEVLLEMGDEEGAYEAFVEVYGRDSNFRDVSDKVSALTP